MRIVQILLLLACLLPIDAFGQKKVLTGVVSDALGTLPGANVFFQARKDQRAIAGVATNMNGEYLLSLDKMVKGVEYEIVFSFIGYRTKVIQYKGQTKLDVNIDLDATLIDEVVVSAQSVLRDGMGMNTKLTSGAQDRIDLDGLKDMAVTSVEDMLQGQLANVDIVAGSGAPGSKMSIRIRGTASLTGNNEPLIVIDDIPKEVEIDDGFDFSTANEDDFGALLGLAPSDIATIDVLKDAAATSMWGAQAANGVLLVTTKRGTKGKPTFEITQRLKTSIEPKRVPMLSGKEFKTLMQDGIWNLARDDEFSTSSMNMLSQYKDILHDPAYAYFDEFNQNVDWLDYVTCTPLSSETNFSMSGGGDKVRYRFSLNYLSEGGTTVGDGYTRINAALNLDYTFSKKFNISSIFSYSDGNRENPVLNVRTLALTKMPNMTPYVLDENHNMTDEYFIQPITTIQGNAFLPDPHHKTIQYLMNPIAIAKESYSKHSEKNSAMNFYLNYKPYNNFTLTGTVSLELGNTHKKGFLPFSATGASWNSERYNRSEESHNYSMRLYTSMRANYFKLINKSNLTVTLRGDMSSSSNASQFSITSGNNGIESSDPSVGGMIRKMEGGIGEGRSLSIAGTFLYSYDNKYNFDISARSDGGSGAGRNARWGISPAAGLNYRMAREDFLSEVDWLSELTFRGSWGYTLKGASGTNTYGGVYTASDEQYMDMGALAPSSMRLDNVDYEKMYQWNVSLEVAILENRITLKTNYYVKTTKDLLQKDMAIPSSSGYGHIGWFNDGSIENKGWEASLSGSKLLPNAPRGWNINFNVNIARNRNVVLDLPASKEYQGVNVTNGSYANKIVEGRPLGAFYGFDYLGVYQNYDQTVATDKSGNVIKDIKGENVVTSINGFHKQRPGDAEYRDLNYDGVIDKYDVIYLGNSMPILTGGGGLTVTWKDLSFRTGFHFRIGQSVINQARFNTESMSGAANQSTAVLRRWRYEGDPTEIPRAVFGRNYNSLGSNRFVENSSFLKIKDLTLTYKLPKFLINRIDLSGVRLVLTCYDPFTFTNYKGQDPEVGIPGGFDNLAKDDSMSPRPRTFAAGLTVNF